MDKMIFSAGIALVCLGVGFLAAPLLDASLSNAFTSGGYLWIILGGITAGFGVRVKRANQTKLGALK